MKKITIITLLFIGSLSKGFSQEIQITSFDVLYKTSNFILSDSSGIRVKPKSNISFNTLSAIDKINFRIYSLESNTLIYNVNYNLSSSDVVSSDGEILYSRAGTNVSISTPNAFSLIPFKFEVETEDSMGNILLTYSEIK